MQTTVPKKRTAPLKSNDLFILLMQSLAITASFIPMLLIGAYPMWVVLGVLVVQFAFWYNLNAVPKKMALAKNANKGIYRKTDVIAKDLDELHKLVSVHNITIKNILKINPTNINEDPYKNLRGAYKAYNKDKKTIEKQQVLVTSSAEYREALKTHITIFYLNKRTEYLKEKHGTDTDLNKFILKGEQDFQNLYQAASAFDKENISEAFTSFIEGSKAWQEIDAKHKLKIHNNKHITEVFSKDTHPMTNWVLSKIFTSKESSYSQSIEYVADKTGHIAAVLGNAVGCAGSGFMITALLKSMPLFVTISNLYAPILLTMALPITLAIILFACGYKAHFCNTVPAIKQIMKESLYVTPKQGNSAIEKDLTKKGYLKMAVKIFSYFAAVVMACAISTINFLTGKFFGWLLASPANLLGLTTAAMATLAAPYTLFGIGLGAVSALVTFIGLICLFSKYVPLGILGLFDTVCNLLGFGDTQPESALKQEDEILQKIIEQQLEKKAQPSLLITIASYLAIAIFVAIATYFANASICFFVANVLGTQFVPITRACGALMYFNQSFDIAKVLFNPEALDGYCTKAIDFAQHVAPSLFVNVDANKQDKTTNERKYMVPVKA